MTYHGLRHVGAGVSKTFIGSVFLFVSKFFGGFYNPMVYGYRSFTQNILNVPLWLIGLEIRILARAVLQLFGEALFKLSLGWAHIWNGRWVMVKIFS